jgi:2-keto-3-deoxy-L-rhamnonate aldolase RhmA
MGYTGEPTHPEVRKAIEHALKAISRAGRVTGTVVDDANVAHYIQIGARCLSVMWPRWVASGAEAFLDGVRHSSNENK